MSTRNHPIEQEELMAYLDGELATNRAVAAAAHLEHCAECQELAADLRKLSQEMVAWEVEQLESSDISDWHRGGAGEAKKRTKKERHFSMAAVERAVYATQAGICGWLDSNNTFHLVLLVIQPAAPGSNGSIFARSSTTKTRRLWRE